MLDKKFLIQNKDLYEKNMLNRGAISDYNTFESLYHNHKKTLEELESARAEQNKITSNSQDAKIIKLKVSELSILEKQLSKDLQNWLLNQPNFLLNEVPFGKNETENQTIFETDIVQKDSLPHDQIIDSLMLKEEANYLSGSRFIVLTNELSNLKRALVSFLLDHNQENGYKTYEVPYIVNEECLYGTGQLPKFREDAFNLSNNQWLISTGEIALVNLFANSTFQDTQPRLCTTYTPCFRKEAGSAGRDTKGLIRLHQFHKVELVSICKAEDAEMYHQKQLETAKSALNKLGIPYRVIIICSGDTGFTASKQYDIEVWLPGSNRFLEIASCSQCGTFQAMRANIKYKTEGKSTFAHTLNGSSLPIERLIAAIVENNFDKSKNIIKVPEILSNYMKTNEIKLG